MAKQVTWEELVIGPGNPEGIARSSARYGERMAFGAGVLLKARERGATHIALYQNTQFDSSALGASSFLFVGGEAQTIKTPEELDEKMPWVGDTPSRRKQLICYAEIPKEEQNG